MIHKNLILAKYKTVEEMAILAKSLAGGEHFEAAIEVVSRLQLLVENFKGELTESMELLEQELALTKKQLAELEVTSGMERVEDVTIETSTFIGFNQPADSTSPVEGVTLVATAGAEETPA